MASSKAFDVVGVDNSSNGRNCERHCCCGHFIEVDDFLYCKWEAKEFDGKLQPCIEVHSLNIDGFVGCHVGYLPRRVIKSSKGSDGKKDGGKKYNGMWLQVIEDLRLSDNYMIRNRSHRNHGIVHCHVSSESFLMGKNPFEDCINLPEQECSGKENNNNNNNNSTVEKNNNDNNDTNNRNNNNNHATTGKENNNNNNNNEKNTTGKDNNNNNKDTEGEQNKNDNLISTGNN